jgi:hypothetical protein
LTALDLTRDFLFHVRSQDVTVQMKVAEVRAVAVLAVEVFLFLVDILDVASKVCQGVIFLLTDFTMMLRWFVILQMILHSFSVLEYFLTLRARRLQTGFSCRVHIIHMNFQLPRRRKSFHTLLAFMVTNLEMRCRFMSF